MNPRSVLGIDFGTVRLGLAHAGEPGIAFPLPAITTPDPDARMKAIDEVVRARAVEAFVVGNPVRPDGTPGTLAEVVDAFAGALERRFRLPVHRVDESFTSQDAEDLGGSRRTRAKGRGPASAAKADRKRGDLDSRAAALILQDWIDVQSPPPPPAWALEEGLVPDHDPDDPRWT